MLFKQDQSQKRKKYMRKKPMFIDVQRFAAGRVRLMLLLLFTCAGIMTLLLQSQVAQAAQGCANDQQIPMGKYYLFNNLWGANTGTGQQCICDVTNTGSSIARSTRWNWSGQIQVKSYDSVVLGWHWQKPTTPYLTGLPLQLSSNQPVRTNWTYNITQNVPNSTFNIAYDLWLHTIPPPAADTPSDEVMLWLYKQGNIHPVGSPVTTVNLNGTTWTLWEGSGNWQVHTLLDAKKLVSGITYL
jgi:Glycosyl hydrolase family 12